MGRGWGSARTSVALKESKKKGKSGISGEQLLLFALLLSCFFFLF